MANADHLSSLKKGVKAWNEWRLEHKPDQADLREVILSGANLFGTTLLSAALDYANFEKAIVGTRFFGSVNLSSCGGLDSIEHVVPSTLGVESIIRSKGENP